MGNRDTEEMLEAARAECVRLERRNTDLENALTEIADINRVTHGFAAKVTINSVIARVQKGNQ